MIVCLDSMICVWAIKKQANDNQKHHLDNAEYLLELIDENKWKVIIPTVVIAEILMVEPEEKYQEYLETINKSFIVAEFDVRAATKYSQILNKNLPDLKKIAKEEGVSRDKMKVDHLILACALVNGAKVIYTHDEKLSRFSEGLIVARSLPSRPTPNLLF